VFSVELVNQLDIALWILAGVVVLVLLVALAKRIYDFRAELHYLNHEIERSHGSNRQYYCRRRRRLWLSILPFVSYNKE